MIEGTLLSNTKTQANLLPSFAAAESNGGSSFRDIMTSLRDKNAGSSVSENRNNAPVSKPDNNRKEAVTNNKGAVNQNRHEYVSSKYETAVSNKQAVSNENKVVSEQKEVSSVDNNDSMDIAFNSEKPLIVKADMTVAENGELNIEDTETDNADNGMLSILNNMSVYINPVNDENVSIKLISDTEELSEINILNMKSMEDVEKLLSDLNLNEEDIARIKDILENASKLSKEELNNLGNIIDSLREGMNKENFSLSNFIDKLTAGKVDLEDLESNIKDLSSKLEALTGTGKDNSNQEENSIKLNDKLTDNISDKESAVEETPVKTDKEVLLNNENSNFDEVLSSIAELVEDIVSISSKQEVNQEVNTVQLSDKEKIGAVLNLLKEYADSASSLTGEKTAKVPEVLKNINIPAAENTVLKETAVIDNSLDLSADDMLLKDKNGLSLRQESEQLLKDLSTGKASAEKISTDVSKQQNILTVKDIQKEFKTMNMEVDESLRGQAQLKADEKAVKVNMADSSKTSLNLGSDKGSLTSNLLQEENFSNNNQEKGNNFNYLLKQSNEVQLKESLNAQNKEVQQPYNLKDSRDIERLLRNIQSSVSKGESKLTVTLTPENLGRLQIQLTESGGKITAKFLSDNENSHKLIMAQSDMLKNQLSEKGIVVDDMQFSFNDAMSKQQEQGSENSKRAGKHAKGRFMKGNEEDAEVGTDIANKNVSGLYA